MVEEHDSHSRGHQGAQRVIVEGMSPISPEWQGQFR